MNNEHSMASQITDTPQFFVLSPKALFIRVFMTAGLYLAYWNYRQWRAIKKFEKTKLSPFWRGAFSIFFISKLTEKIHHHQQKSAQDTGFEHKKVGVMYIAVFICNYLFSRTPGAGPLIALIGLVLLVAESYVLKDAQVSINSFTATRTEKTTPGQVAIYVFGFILFLLYGAVLLIPTDGI